ncbi:hypothetical protein XENOCAPTIV_013168 [Xenoophorus captivus]|uniref:Uncharacterized protein n=1 Tax=Xenoophorus captivus TaxID=1517983 RepID=A0ABV0S6T0_9TELE
MARGLPDSLDFKGQLGKRVRKERPYTSQTAAFRAYQVFQDPWVHLVIEVLMVHLVSKVQEDLTDSLDAPVLLGPKGRWAAVVTFIEEGKETRYDIN